VGTRFISFPKDVGVDRNGRVNELWKGFEIFVLSLF